MAKRTTIRRPLRRRGAAQAWVAASAVALIGLVGLALDTSWTYFVGHKLQHAVEAGALAGALLVRGDPEAARDAAVELAAEHTAAGVPVMLGSNIDNEPDGDVVLGRFSRDSGELDLNQIPNAVQVRATRDVGLFFGPLFGVPTVTITRTATAMTAGGDGAALLVLHPSADRALDLTGGVTLRVIGGPIQVNSSHATRAANFANNVTLDAEQLRLVGGLTGTVNVPVQYGVQARPDPLASIPEPSVAGRPQYAAGAGNIGSNQSGTLSPGYYPDGIDILGTATLEPGIYITGSLNIGAQASVTGHGVMFFVTCENQNNQNSTAVNIVAGPNVILSPPDPQVHNFADANVYEGMLLFQKRNRTNPVSYTFSSDATFMGTWYYPSARVRVASSGLNHLARLIASEISASGQGIVTISFQGNQTATGGNAFLVQ
jgi:Flp pilus assembly protein TadG